MQLPNQGLVSQTGYPRMHIAQTDYPRVQYEYTLDKRCCKGPNPQTSLAAFSREQQDKQCSLKENTSGQRTSADNTVGD